jgi:branched-chain amino acid transport system substrate-binding protein
VVISSSLCIAKPSKDKIIIGQATSLSGPFAPSNAVISVPYYEYWIKTVNAAGGIYVKEYGKKLPMMISMV